MIFLVWIDRQKYQSVEHNSMKAVLETFLSFNIIAVKYKNSSYKRDQPSAKLSTLGNYVKQESKSDTSLYRMQKRVKNNVA